MVQFRRNRVAGRIYFFTVTLRNRQLRSPGKGKARTRGSHNGR